MFKAYCDINRANPNPELDYSIQNLFIPISQIFPSYFGQGNFYSDTTHYFICDVGEYMEHKYQQIKQLRDAGIKVVLFTFDPANFKRVRKYVEYGAIDKVIVFTEKFKNRFPCKTYFTDYFFPESAFEQVNTENNGKVCIYGRIDEHRPNEFGLDIIDRGASSLKEIYKNIQKYNGVITYDDGFDEDFITVDHYNKARATETLMCGRIPYCKPGIVTKRYNKYLKKYDDAKTPCEITFSQQEIWQINLLTLLELKYELENI